jgi:hypothetical protein
MESKVEQIATDWIAYARYSSPSEAPEQVQADGWALYELAEDQPELGWEIIRHVVRQCAEEDLFSDTETEAQNIAGLLAAGPLEDLLAFHGANFIERIEAEARRDRRMFWTLGGVWQNSMTDEVWERVQRAAGGISR